MAFRGVRLIVVRSFQHSSNESNAKLWKSTIRLYLVGLYENNSLGLWSSFFRKDSSHHLLDPPSDPENSAPIPIIVCLTFLSVVYGTKVFPAAKQISPDYFEVNTKGLQFLMVQTLSQGAVDKVHQVVLIYIPSVFIFFCYLGSLIFFLRVPILASTSIFPSVIRYHTGRFVGAVQRCASLCPLPCGSANSNLKVSQRPPIDRIICHFVAFGQVLLFVGWHIWIFLLVYFVDETLRKIDVPALADFETQFILYPSTVVVLIYTWVIAATGGLGESRWWPSRGRLSRFIPPSMKNATMTKCMWTLLFYRA